MMGADCHATYYPMVVMARTLSLAMYLNRAVMVEYAVHWSDGLTHTWKEHWYVDEIQKVQYQTFSLDFFCTKWLLIYTWPECPSKEDTLYRDTIYNHTDHNSNICMGMWFITKGTDPTTINRTLGNYVLHCTHSIDIRGQSRVLKRLQTELTCVSSSFRCCISQC